MNSTDLIIFLYQKKSWDDRLTGPFLSLGFEDPKTAWRNLTALGGQVNFEKLYPTFFPSFLEFLGQSYNADLACNNFERLAEKIHDKENLYARLTQSSEFLRVLLILFSGSQVLTDTLLNDPSHLDWLSQPETLTESKTRDRLYREFYAMAAAREGNTIPSLLRRFKKREYIRIGLRDLLGLVELAENVESLSDLAMYVCRWPSSLRMKPRKKNMAFLFMKMPTAVSGNPNSPFCPWANWVAGNSITVRIST